jgi:hypothetical protein
LIIIVVVAVVVHTAPVEHGSIIKLSTNDDRFYLTFRLVYMESMDDDFLAEHVLPSMNRSNTTHTLLVDGVTSSNDIQHTRTSTSSETGIDLALNALNEHIESTSRFFNNALLSDIRLRVGTTIYYAHKFILAKSSDVLATLLYSQHWTSTENEIVLEEQDECQGDVFDK